MLVGLFQGRNGGAQTNRRYPKRDRLESRFCFLPYFTEDSGKGTGTGPTLKRNLELIRRIFYMSKNQELGVFLVLVSTMSITAPVAAAVTRKL